jgi:hypothetical protein
VVGDGERLVETHANHSSTKQTTRLLASYDEEEKCIRQADRIPQKTFSEIFVFVVLGRETCSSFP